MPRETTTEIHKHELRMMLDATLPHVSTDKTLPMINAINVELGNNRLTVAATDRYTMGVATSQTPVSGAPATALIPISQIKRLIPIIRGAEVSLEVTITTYDERISTLTVRCICTGIALEMRSLEAAFVDYRKPLRDAVETRGAQSEIALTPEFMARLKPVRGTVHVQMGETSTAPIIATAGDWFAALVMPQKQKGGEEATPSGLADFVDAITEKATSEETDAVAA